MNFTLLELYLCNIKFTYMKYFFFWRHIEIIRCQKLGYFIGWQHEEFLICNNLHKMFLRTKNDIFNIYLRWSIFGEEKTELIFCNIVLPTTCPKVVQKYIMCLEHMTRTDSVSEKLTSYNKSQRDALFHKYTLVRNSTCFRQIYCPSSGVSTLYTQQ